MGAVSEDAGRVENAVELNIQPDLVRKCRSLCLYRVIGKKYTRRL
jgi:hypothetical protein